MMTITKDPRSTPTTAIYRIAGPIDDRSEFAPISASSEPEVIVNFDKAENINSYGVRKMLYLAQSLKGRKVSYEDCRPDLITQLNMIPALTSGIAISSFYIPLECDACDQESDRRITHQEAMAPGFLAKLNDTFPCDRCSRKLKFMDDESLFFGFLNAGAT